MKQITGALIGIAVVLSAVFVPMAFFPGSAGAIYRQFSVTIVSAMTLSVFVALILSPSLCAAILQKKNDKSNFSNKKFFTKFNALLKKLRKFYINRANFITRRTRKFISVYLILIIGLIIIFNKFIVLLCLRSIVIFSSNFLTRFPTVCYLFGGFIWV